jgi:uncharacterized repeat protein (TIGR04052 family)
MKNQRCLLSIGVIAAILWGSSGNSIQHHAQAVNPQEVTIRFKATFDERVFACGLTYALYDNIGQPITVVTPTDLRFYVSDVALINSQGKAVPIALTQDGKWQYRTVALLDFENKSGACVNGTTEMRDRVIGTVPPGDYKGLQFTLGVPPDLNHNDATLAPSPLNLTSLWWNWQGGYKFLRADFKHQSQTHTPKTKQHHQDKGHNDTVGFPIHLGSTGCKPTGVNQKSYRCSQPNTANVRFPTFNLQKQTVFADLGVLLTATNSAINHPNTTPGCMSEANDPDCRGIMARLGLGSSGQRSTTQTFFRVED